MKIDAVLARHPWPWNLNASMLSSVIEVIDADCWQVFEVRVNDRKRTIDILEALLATVEAHVKAKEPGAGEGREEKP